MGQPVEKGPGETLIPENLCPPLKLQVGGDDHRPGEIAARAELEEGLASRSQESIRACLPGV